mmetsp:Transcript_24559/g.46597  ORF Transcript_24559/g.46597 Transcript_24559/m.46597 type:complete len:89 (-) Transcript_24559:1224-1490(-)
MTWKHMQKRQKEALPNQVVQVHLILLTNEQIITSPTHRPTTAKHDLAGYGQVSFGVDSTWQESIFPPPHMPGSSGATDLSVLAHLKLM